jgi:hypothetical protein
MTTPVALNWEVLTTAVRSEIIESYQHQSLLSLFPSVPIPKGIAAEKWAQKYIVESKRAGVHRRGFNPNRVTMDFSGFEITPCTVDQAMVLDEIALSQFAESGMLDKSVSEIGKNMAYTANTWLMMHKGGNAEAAPFTEYHYLLADGSGNGTAARPNWLQDASSAGAWSTLSNAFTDLSRLKGGFIAKGGNFDTSILLIPKCFAPGVEKIRSEYQNKAISDYLTMQGFRWMYVEDDFMKTTASSFGTLPAITAGDIVLIDPTEFVIGYQRPETITQGKGTFPDRNYYIEAELWYALLCVPFRKNEAGTVKTYKSAARASAINAT